MRFCLTLLMVFAWTCGSVCPAQPLSISELESDHLAVEGLLSDPPEECDAFSQEPELSRFKKQALQSLSITGGFASDVSGNGLSASYVDLSIGTGVPLGSLDNILGVKPRVRVDWIDADPSLDVPRELYDFELLFFYRRPIRERLSAMAVVSPSIRSDLTTSDDAFRVFALGLLNWECIPERLTLSGGVSGAREPQAASSIAPASRITDRIIPPYPAPHGRGLPANGPDRARFRHRTHAPQPRHRPTRRHRRFRGSAHRSP